jgi:myo-inositol-1(or 4)-monophosphatase
MSSSRLELAQNTALQTGKMLLERYRAGDRQGFLKADRTLVTEADQTADRFIQEQIARVYPDDGVLSEESSTIFPDKEHVWVIDPLDGTVNFSRGICYWGVSIAHLENGHPQTAALYFPAVDELFSAVRGGGAFLNGSPLQVSEEFDRTLFPIFVHCSRIGQHYQVSLPYKKRSLGAAAYHLCLISTNTAVLAFESTPRIWDFAGAWLIVKESGGVIESLNEGQPFPARPGTDYHNKPYPIAAAVSKEVLANARENIRRRIQ